jgi:hypothetical protein
MCILILELFIIVSLLRVEIVESGFVLVIYILQLLFRVFNISFHVSLLGEQVVQMRNLFVILVFVMHVEGLDIFWLGVNFVHVKSQLIVSELTLLLSNTLIKLLIVPFKIKICSIILVDLLYLTFHLINFSYDLIVRAFEQVVVVGTVVDLTIWTLID